MEESQNRSRGRQDISKYVYQCQKCQASVNITDVQVRETADRLYQRTTRREQCSQYQQAICASMQQKRLYPGDPAPQRRRNRGLQGGARARVTQSVLSARLGSAQRRGGLAGEAVEPAGIGVAGPETNSAGVALVATEAEESSLEELSTSTPPASVSTRQGGAGRSSCAGQLVALGGRRQGPVDLCRGGVAGGPSTASDAGGVAGGAGASAWSASTRRPPLCPPCVAEDAVAVRSATARAEPSLEGWLPRCVCS